MKKIVYILTLAVAIALCSCQKSEEANPNTATTLSAVEFTSTISTRATATTWGYGDMIGVSMYPTGETLIYDDSENAPYTTSGGESGAFYSVSNPLYYPADATNVDFVAYHPYSSDYSNSQVTLNTANQSTEALVEAQDFMVASAQNCNESNTPSLAFTRQMSKITLNVNSVSNNVVLTDISLSGLVTEGTFSIINAPSYRENASVVAGESLSEISLYLNETSDTIEAIIIPQTIASATLTLWVNGAEFVATISGTFAEDTHYSYTLTIDADQVELSGATITDWGTVEEDDLSLLTYGDILYNAETLTYDIYTGDGLRVFSDLVNGLECSISNLYFNDNSYFNFDEPNATINGRLMADIDLGGIDDNGAGVEAKMFSAIGSELTPYSGTFDGCEYKVSGLYIYTYTAYQGLFGYTDGATIKNLGVDGSVSGYDRCGGIVGFASNSSIESCYNLSDVIAGSRCAGGIAGSITSSSTISNCYNRGQVSAGYSAGGVVGIIDIDDDDNFPSITCCYNAGAVIYSLAGNSGNGITNLAGSTNKDLIPVYYCYYDTTVADIVIGAVDGYADDTTYCGLTTEQMTTDGTLLYYLTDEDYGNSTMWKADTENINDGYPILTWQSSNN